MNEIRFAEGFAGIGGFRYGMQKASSRYKCIWANDNDSRAQVVYTERYGYGEFECGDFKQIDKKSIPDHDIFCGGFPCQSFSIAGDRKGFEDVRGTLFFDICEVLWLKRPSYIWLENVKGLLNHDGGNTFYSIQKYLGELGYNLQWQLLNSKNFGVPQNRERVFIIGHLKGKRRPKVFPIEEGYRISEKERCSRIYSGGKGIAYCLDTNYWKGGALRSRTVVLIDGQYRFLTPIECERLQGFPDNWTKTQFNNNEDRYHVLGNSVTTTVIEAIAKRLLEVFT
jgi:DNA (cytosine-5)-methyltransferase 1